MSGRSRIVLRTVALGVLLALAFGVPAYLTAQPGYFRRYPLMAAKWEPWSTSTHVEAGCAGCHVEPRALPQVIYRARMIGEFYLGLAFPKREPDLFAKPSNAACMECHSDLRSVSPEGDLQIPHRAHINVLKMECVACHGYLVHELSPEGKHAPPMGGCMECHDGDAAKNACTACHTEKAAPETHRAPSWVVEHASRATDPACETCHGYTEKWCVDCHETRPRSHGSDWRGVHGEAVAKHRSCEACHEGPFCVRCHGEVPAVNFDPDLKLVVQ